MTPPALRRQAPQSDPAPGHPLLSVRQVAGMLGCSEMTIRRRIYAAQLPAVRIGRKALVPREFVEQLLAAAGAGQTVVLEEFMAAWTARRAPAP